jgi:mono/diheme cytochrome c family protein
MDHAIGNVRSMWMRNSQQQRGHGRAPGRALGLLLALLVGAASACGEDGSPGEAPDAGAPDTTSSSSELVSAGRAAVTTHGCQGCHGSDLSGARQPLPGTLVYPANLTPDPETGIGDWTDQEITRAIRQGIDDADESLCTNMPHFAAIEDAEAAAIVAFLRSLPAVSHAVPESSCPPLK